MSKNQHNQQIWGHRLSSPPDELNIAFCAGRDVTSLPMADESLLEYDIWTNLAHTQMLYKVGILNSDEYHQLKNALLSLQADHQKGTFQLDPAKEDVHINVEHYITQVKGIEAGKKIHTGRSRNDQIATDMRLYCRDKILSLSSNISFLITSILQKSKAEKNTLMPGFTHYQPAMSTTVAHWLTNWSQALLRDLTSLLHNLQILNLSPLGASASFGTSWPIDRELSAELLAFDQVEENSLDCITSRGENEARIASSVSFLMNHLSIIAQDIILLSTPYYNMLAVDDKFVTGSSIMPQKRNPDFAELIRSKAAISHGILMSLLAIQKGAMSGYSRDSQSTKYLFMDLIRECCDAPSILGQVISSLVFKREVMLAQCQVGFINSADGADWLAQKYLLPFRDCYEVFALTVKYSESKGKLTYQALKRALKELELSISFTQKDIDFLNSPSSMLGKKQHTGAPSPEAVNKMIISQTKRLQQLENQLDQVVQKIDHAKKKCFSR